MNAVIAQQRSTDEAIRLAHSTGLDAGNRAMRRAGRTAWSNEDWDIAADTWRRTISATGYGLGATTPL